MADPVMTQGERIKELEDCLRSILEDIAERSTETYVGGHIYRDYSIMVSEWEEYDLILWNGITDED